MTDLLARPRPVQHGKTETDDEDHEAKPNAMAATPKKTIEVNRTPAGTRCHCGLAQGVLAVELGASLALCRL